MANPTTNYSFVLPTSTDLVTDLPADFDVALQGVDTRLKALQPGTTAGDLAYSSATANTNVRLAIGTAGQVLSVVSGVPAWTTGTAGDIEGVTAGIGISGGGTSGTVTVTNSMATAIDAKGDLVVGTAGDTFSRLAVGTNGQVLTADSTTPTGLKYATPGGGAETYTLLTTVNMAGIATTTLSSITSSKLILHFVDGKSTGFSPDIQVRFNGNTTAANYLFVGQNIPAVTGNNAVFSFNGNVNRFITGSSSPTNGDAAMWFNAENLQSTSLKPVSYFGGPGDSGNQVMRGYGAYVEAAVITSVTFMSSGANFTAGTLKIYGA